MAEDVVIVPLEIGPVGTAAPRAPTAADILGVSERWVADAPSVLPGPRLELAPDPLLLFVEWRPLTALRNMMKPWKVLAARALERNIFYEPAFALAAAPVFGRDAGALLVWAGTDRRKLLGLFPARIERLRYGVPFPVLVGWTHPFAPFGVPLVDRDSAEAAIEAAFQFLGKGVLPTLWLLPFMPSAGKFAAALAAVIIKRQGGCVWFGEHARAALSPPLMRGKYVVRAISPKKRKELRRQMRQLADQGDVTLDRASTAAEMAGALDDFLALEACGWKGDAGSAAAQQSDVQAFMRDAVRALGAAGQVQIDRLQLQGRTIAASILLRSGPAAWFWKITYDEEVARASPGVQLTVELTHALLADPTIGRTDSCATANHPMIDHLWRERLELGDQLISVSADPKARFILACRLEDFRRRAIETAKWARPRVKAAISDLSTRARAAAAGLPFRSWSSAWRR